jgi:hypothetical protein
MTKEGVGEKWRGKEENGEKRKESSWKKGGEKEVKKRGSGGARGGYDFRLRPPLTSIQSTKRPSLPKLTHTTFYKHAIKPCIHVHCTV